MAAGVESVGRPGPAVGALEWLRSAGLGLTLLSLALLYNAITLPDEARINVVPLNDDAFHAAATDRLAEAIASGEPFLDPWVANWGLGFPIWRSYQPLPHVVAAPVVLAAAPRRAAVFAISRRSSEAPPGGRLGRRALVRPLSRASGIASLLVSCHRGREASGTMASATPLAFSGPGLYTQQFAFLLLPIALGIVRDALDSGRWRLLAAALLSAPLSHIVFGYVGALAAVILALVGSRGAGPHGSHASCGSAPAPSSSRPGSRSLSSSRVDQPLALRTRLKWDSFGSRAVLSRSFGSLLDAGRLPILTALLGLRWPAASPFAATRPAAASWRSPSSSSDSSSAGTRGGTCCSCSAFREISTCTASRRRSSSRPAC